MSRREPRYALWEVEGEAKADLWILGLGLACSFGAWPVRGWAASVLWGWFAVPLGAPVVDVLPAMGLLLVVTLVRGAQPNPEADVPEPAKTNRWTARAVADVLLPLILLALGAIVRGAM